MGRSDEFDLYAITLTHIQKIDKSDLRADRGEDLEMGCTGCFTQQVISSGSYIAIIGEENNDVEWYDQGTLTSSESKSRLFSGSKIEVVLFAIQNLTRGSFYQISSVDVALDAPN